MPPGTGTGIPLTYQDLTGKDFKGQKLYKADLRGTNFSKADMKGISLFGAFCKDAKFNGADLSNADLESVDFEGADLSEAVLEGAQVGGDYAPIHCPCNRIYRHAPIDAFILSLSSGNMVLHHARRWIRVVFHP